MYYYVILRLHICRAGTSLDSVALQASENAVALPPPVEPVRTEKGVASFPDLLLPAPPPMYRPFIIMEERKKSKTKTDSQRESTYIHLHIYVYHWLCNVTCIIPILCAFVIL